MGRNICDFCEREVDNLKIHVENNVNYTICEDCLSKIAKHKCIECGRPVDDEMSVFRGRCIAYKQYQ